MCTALVPPYRCMAGFGFALATCSAVSSGPAPFAKLSCGPAGGSLKQGSPFLRSRWYMVKNIYIYIYIEHGIQCMLLVIE